MTELLFKFLKKDGGAYHGGKGKWHLPKGDRPGRWMPKILNIEACVRGYHLCREQDVLKWLGPTLWIAEAKGERKQQSNKIVVGQARLIKKVEAYNGQNLRLFAADCAERVLHIFEKACPTDDRPRKAIEAARLYAQGKITAKELAAAHAAAYAAAYAAAGAAARAAAGAAAYAAAADADAYAAAYAAAHAAAHAAADAAAADAAADAAAADAAAADAARAARAVGEREWQLKHFMDCFLVEKEQGDGR